MAKAPARVEAVVADALEYLGERTFPQGFKAQFVAVDRVRRRVASGMTFLRGLFNV